MNTKKQPRVSHTTNLNKERLRRRYRPSHVRILFVGEAPPASGRFFYQADSGLYRAMRETFIHALPVLKGTNFLESFRGLGCYLVDLCGNPVDRLDLKLRKQACVDGEVRLSRMIQKLRPTAVVTLVRSIAPNVRRARQFAKWNGRQLELPYPGRWKHHRIEFDKKLVQFLRQMQSD